MTYRRVHARGMNEGAPPGTAGPRDPTAPAMLGARPSAQPKSLARRDRNRFRSLQGRVTTATPVPRNWDFMYSGMTRGMKAHVSTMLTDKRLEYCTAGAPLQGFVRRNGGCKPTSTALRGAFRLDNAVTTSHCDGRWQRFGHFVASGDAETRSIGTSSSRHERWASLCTPRIHVHGPLRGLEAECDRGKVVACSTNRVFAITSLATKSIHFSAPRRIVRAMPRAITR